MHLYFISIAVPHLSTAHAYSENGFFHNKIHSNLSEIRKYALMYSYLIHLILSLGYKGNSVHKCVIHCEFYYFSNSNIKYALQQCSIVNII